MTRRDAGNVSVLAIVAVVLCALLGVAISNLGRAVTDKARQCVLDPDDPSTWRPCRSTKGSGLVWWDVFAIPSGRATTRTDGAPVTIG